jgi:hypothetical protein
MFRQVPYWRFIHIPIATFAISPINRNAPKRISAVTSGLIALLPQAGERAVAPPSGIVLITATLALIILVDRLGPRDRR